MSAFPGDTVNPLDLTGFVFSRADLMQEVFVKYASVVDLLVLGWWAGDGDADWSSRMLEPLALAAADVDTPVVVSPVEATSIGAWVTSWRDRGVLFGRGIESVFHAADALDRFVAGPLATLALGRRRRGRRARARRGAGADRQLPPARWCPSPKRWRCSRAPVFPSRPGRRSPRTLRPPTWRGWRRASVPTRRQAGERPASHRARRRPGRRRRRGRSSTQSPSCAPSPVLTRSMPPSRSRRWSAATPRRSPACTAGPGWATCSCSAAVVCSSS